MLSFRNCSVKKLFFCYIVGSCSRLIIVNRLNYPVRGLILHTLKKILSISMLLVFWFSTIGVPLSKHFCGETHKLVSTGILASPKSCCETEDRDLCEDAGDHCNMDLLNHHNAKHKGCCENEFSYLKIKEDYTPTIQADFSPELTQIIVELFIPVFESSEIYTQAHLLAANLPPPYSGTDNRVLFQSFLF